MIITTKAATQPVTKGVGTTMIGQIPTVDTRDSIDGQLLTSGFHPDGDVSVSTGMFEVVMTSDQARAYFTQCLAQLDGE